MANFKGFDIEEIKKYLQWEDTQNFHENYPDSLRIREYNKTLQRADRFDEFGLLVSVARDYRVSVSHTAQNARLTYIHPSFGEVPYPDNRM